MSKLFMYGTPLEGIEQLMVMVPNFSTRRSGIVINNYFNCEEGVVDCNVINLDNKHDICGYFDFNAGIDVEEMKYKDLVKECFVKIKNYSLKDRLKLLTSNFKGELFLDHRHKERFYQVFHKQDLDINDISSRYIAVTFLLTADEVLWNLSEHTVRINGFDFNKTHLREINADGYTLHQTAKTIWIGKEYIRISEIADADLIDDIIFKAIINSVLIARYGADIFLITK